MVTTGMHICIVGPDGAGKTTMADLLTSQLEESGFRVTRLSPRPDWFHTVSPSTFDYHNPHAEKPRTPAKSGVQVVKKLAFFVLRRARSRNTTEIYIEERGWLDQAVDHRRYRMNERVIPLIERLAWIAGRPDLTVVLGGDADIIAERKSELSGEEVARQLDRWDDLLLASPAASNTVTFDTTELSVDNTVTQLRTTLLERMKP